MLDLFLSLKKFYLLKIENMYFLRKYENLTLNFF
jgi:hypothetical protein